MHCVRRVNGDGAGSNGIGHLLVVDVAGRNPPRSRDHVCVTLLIVKVRLREIAGIPFDDHAIESRLVWIPEEHGLLHPAFLAGPLEVLRQDGGNMRWIRWWAHRVVDGRLGALRLGNPGKNSGADDDADGYTDDHHSVETHTGLLRLNCR